MYGESPVQGVVSRRPAHRGEKARTNPGSPGGLGTVHARENDGLRLRARGAATGQDMMNREQEVRPVWIARRIRSMGLGLANVKRYAEAHGGTVRAETSPGERGVFRLVLPLGR